MNYHLKSMDGFHTAYFTCEILTCSFPCSSSRKRGSISEASYVCSIKKGTYLLSRQPCPIEWRLGRGKEEGQSVQVQHKLYCTAKTPFFLTQHLLKQHKADTIVFFKFLNLFLLLFAPDKDVIYSILRYLCIYFGTAHVHVTFGCNNPLNNLYCAI